MKSWTFSRKVSASIALSSLIVALVLSVFVYITFRHWSDRQQTDLLEAKLKQFELRIKEVGFLPSLLTPGLGKGKGAAAVFNPDLSSMAAELGDGQALQLLDSGGRVLAEAGAAEPDAQDIAHQAEREFSLLVFGDVTLRLTDRGVSASAAAAGEIGRILLFGLVIATGVAVATGWLVARSALRPIRSMIGEARGIGAGNLSQRLQMPAAEDELHQLAETFNGLLQRLEVSFEQQHRFVADASHELKTPLAIIEGHANMIQRWGRSSPEVLAESLTFMTEETGRMKELISQLLLLAEAEQGLPGGSAGSCFPEDILAELLPQLAQINPGVQLKLEPGGQTAGLPVRMNKEACRRVLRNIIENALKYTPEGGTVSIGLRSGAGQVMVTVADTGIGISPGHLPHIFDRFYRAEGSRNRAGGGSGLGLAIVKAMMERHGGSVSLESLPGEGTVVTLRFAGGSSGRVPLDQSNERTG
ncbi:sensor histidine kinase [Paenibacillus tengchongensis]|uniref:sensor histidine kinase n=1 Tax=Paenibacillus tengchongensis TaxID=2608684 RepID=UPI00124E7EAC|nr:ATP-binding protein [Paenibacillus tengchongensis]